MRQIEQVYKFPISDILASRWAAPIFIAVVGFILLIYGAFEEGALYFGAPIFVVGMLLISFYI